jgi:hypothetical protein
LYKEVWREFGERGKRREERGERRVRRGKRSFQ